MDAALLVQPLTVAAAAVQVYVLPTGLGCLLLQRLLLLAYGFTNLYYYCRSPLQIFLPTVNSYMLLYCREARYRMAAIRTITYKCMKTRLQEASQYTW